jgi:flagellar biosynthesis protein FliR
MMLDRLIGGSLFVFLMAFVRLGSAFLVLPGIGEQFVSARIRLLLALSTAFVMMPVLGPLMPAPPQTPADLVSLIVAESLIGIFIGSLARVMMSALEMAGLLIANQVGLSAAQAFNPALASPTNPITSLLNILALVLIFATDLHHLLLLAAAESYSVFPPGTWLPLSDATAHAAQIMGDSFVIALQMAAPFTVVGLLFYLGLGLVARLTPQIQVFFVGAPIQISLGLLMLGLSLSSLMTFWLARLEEQLIGIVQP